MVRVVERSTTCKKNGHWELESDPVLLIFGVVNKINVSQLIVSLGAPKSKRLVGTFVAPENEWEVEIQSFLQSLKLILSNILMIDFTKRREDNSGDHE